MYSQTRDVQEDETRTEVTVCYDTRGLTISTTDYNGTEEKTWPPAQADLIHSMIINAHGTARNQYV